MNNFKKAGGFRKSFGGDRRGSTGQGGGGYKPRFNDDRPKQMFQTTCSECSKACEVPFRPTGERPVYCRDCFAREGRGATSDFRDHRPRYHTNQVGVVARNDFSHKKFGQNRDFRPPRSDVKSADVGFGDLKKQMEALNGKIDRLIAAIESGNKAVALEAVVKKVAGKKKAGSKKK